MLIDRVEIAKHREISKAVREDKIRPYIEDAQRLDLKPLLGERLFNAIEKAPTEHTLLMDGGEYTVNDVTYNHPGLKKVLSIFAYARYVMFGSFNDTPFGFVEKNLSESKSVSDTHKRTLYTYNQQIATGYFNEVALFMNRKNYDLWKTSGCAPKSSGGFRISKIS